MARASGDSDEVTLPRPAWWTSSPTLTPALVPLLPLAAFNFTLPFVRDLPLGWIIAIMTAVLVGALALIWLIIRVRFPPARLDPATSTIRVGRRQARYRDISSAQLFVVPTRKRRGINLLLRDGSGLRALVRVGDGHERALSPDAALLLQDMLRQSNVAIPTSTDDPTGKFARYNFPDHLTKADAIELVEHPPTIGDELPIPPRI